MNIPIEVKLKYRYEGNCSFTLAVDPVANASYIWQKCQCKTANWEEVDTTNTNLKIITVSLTNNNGDRYRCIISVNGIVTYYTISFVVSADKFATNNKSKQQGSNNNNNYNYNKSRSNNYSDSNNYRQKEPSVSDTDGMDGLAFERYCSNVLRKNGFYDIEITRGSGDYGIDILAKKDSISYAIQCKCYTGTVSNKAIQEAFSGKSFYGCMVAAVLTNSYFTESAKETAKRNDVLLWDRNYLDRLIKSAYTSQSKSDNYDNTSGFNKKAASTATNTKHDYFKGCNNLEQIKERYRALMKMYHPDTASGDEEYSKEIISQYEALKQKYR